MSKPDEPNLTDAAGQLTSAVQTLTTSVQKLSSYSKRSRRLIWWTIAGLVLDVTLTVIVGWLFNDTRSINHRIERNAHTQVVFNFNQCQRGKQNIIKLNAATTVFIQFLEANNRPPKPAITQWITIQRQALLTVPECGPKP